MGINFINVVYCWNIFFERLRYKDSKRFIVKFYYIESNKSFIWFALPRAWIIIIIIIYGLFK